jgi:PleD family two-component response regulator
MIEPQLEIEAQTKSQNVADIGQYKKPESSTIELVMSQIKIASHSDFEKQLAQHWQAAANEKQLLSVLICEIDFYHEYVEKYGLQGASFMLLVVALALKNICDQHGLFCPAIKRMALLF